MRVGQRLHRAVREILHPGLQRVGAMHQVAGLVVQPPQRIADRRPRDRADAAIDSCSATMLSNCEGPSDRSRRGRRRRRGTPATAAGTRRGRTRPHAQRAVRSRRAAPRQACRRRRLPRRARWCSSACSAAFRRRRLGHHVDEQLLDLAGLVDATRHLPGRGRTPGRHRCPQCVDVAGDPVGHLRHPTPISAQSSSVSVAIRSNTSRIDCSGEAITFSSPTSSRASCSSICRPSRSRIAATVTRSTSSTGLVPSRSRNAARAASTRAVTPSGE